MTEFLFYLHATISVLAMLMAMITFHAIHALLYAVFSLITLAISMYLLAAPLAAALEAIVYAGAIMVLFVFAVMLLQTPALKKSASPLPLKKSALALTCFIVFWAELFFALRNGLPKSVSGTQTITEIAHALFGTYGLLVEVISFVLLSGLVVAIFVGESFISANRERNT